MLCFDRLKIVTSTKYIKDKNALQGKIDLIKNPNRSNIEPILTILYLT